MARIITRQHAEKIAKKLKAKFRETRAHSIAEIYHNGLLVADFGIRRGSEKDKGHDHVQGALFVSAGDAKRLAECPMTLGMWIARMQEKGYIDVEEEGN